MSIRVRTRSPYTLYSTLFVDRLESKKIFMYRLGLDSIEKKFGGGRINPDDPKVRQTNEKFTDGARSKFESMTG